MNYRLQAQGVSCSYRRRPALFDFDLHMTAGETVGLYGSNGAGKSTALATLTGCLPPQRGEILLDDEPLYSDRLERRRLIGYLPQGQLLYPDLTVRENLAFAARMQGLERSAIDTAVDGQLEQMELTPFVHRLGQELSTGMARRVALGMSMIHAPDFLLLDEPTAGLDPAQAQRLRQLLKRLAPGRVIVIASHLAADIEQTCSRALLLDGGRTLSEQTLHTDRILALVEFGKPPADAQLLAIDGIRDVQAPPHGEPGNRRVLHLDPGVRTAWPELLARQGWELQRFEPRHSLLADHSRAGTGQA